MVSTCTRNFPNRLGKNTNVFLPSAGQFDGQGDHSPKPFVRKTFTKYLECGILAHGFALARCGDCEHGYLVAFSCKGWGVCPSCISASPGKGW